MIKAVFFDLFFTLVKPDYAKEEAENEYGVLAMGRQEWERYAEDEALYRERALGNVTDERIIIEKIAQILPCPVSENQKERLLFLRKERMRCALNQAEEQILDSLQELKGRGIKLCLISNADVIDKCGWETSPFSSLFDAAVFSCDVHRMKPDIEIYRYAMELMQVKPEESLYMGDGGFDELRGAKEAGMKAILCEHFLKREPEDRAYHLKYADYVMTSFEELPGICNGII